MASANRQQQEIKEYLLGSASEDARREIEQRLLTDEDFFAELVAGEDELIDEYLNETLSAEERGRFESHFLSTRERQQKLSFGEAFGRYVAERSGDANAVAAAAPVAAEQAELASRPAPPAPELSWNERLSAFWRVQTWALRAAIAFALVAVVVGAFWFSGPSRSSSPKTFVALSLSASHGTRAEGVAPAKVKLDADALRVTLTLAQQAAPSARYRVELLDREGEARPVAISGQDARSVSVEILAGELARGDYALKLYGVGADGTEQPVGGNYYFTVE